MTQGGVASAVALFYGSDGYVIEKRTEDYLKGLLPLGRKDLAYEEIDASEMSVAEGLLLASSQSLLSEETVVWLRQAGFLLPGAAKKKEQEEFLAYLDDPNPTCRLILTLQTEKKPSAFLKKVIQKCYAVACEPIKGRELYTWLEDLARTHDKTWSQRAMHTLQELEPYTTTAQLMQEAEKALLFSADTEVQGSEVQEILSPTPQFSIFNLIDAVLDNQPEKALRAWQDCFYLGENAGKVIYMLGDTLKRLLVIQALRAQGRSQQEIQKAVNRPAFVIRRNIQQSQRFPAERLVRALDKLLTEDQRRKTVPGLRESTFIEELLVVLMDILHHQVRNTSNRGMNDVRG